MGEVKSDQEIRKEISVLVLRSLSHRMTCTWLGAMGGMPTEVGVKVVLPTAISEYSDAPYVEGESPNGDDVIARIRT